MAEREGMRWLYHVARKSELNGDDPYRPPSFAREGFVHASFRDQLAETVAIHFRGEPEDTLAVLQLDPRRAGVPVTLAETARGQLPHIQGAIPRDAIRATLELSAAKSGPDRVTGTRWCFIAFPEMTLLDLVGVYDAVSRIATMGFDPTARFELVSTGAKRVFARDGASLDVERVRPPLDAFDVVIIAGGHGTRALQEDREVLDWLAAFPKNRVLASVCTGSLVLGAAGRLQGKRATTHHRRLDDLRRYGALPERARVIDEGTIITAAGVTSTLDLGLHLVRRFEGDEIAARIAAQMEMG